MSLDRIQQAMLAQEEKQLLGLPVRRDQEGLPVHLEVGVQEARVQ